MTTWQQQNPGKCARCNTRLSGYNPALPPVCDRCAGKTAAVRTAAGSERLYPVQGVQCAAMVKDWKASWDLTELQELQELVSGANGGTKVVATEFADGSDSNWMLIHPAGFSPNFNDEDLVEYITSEEEDYEGEDAAIWQDLVSRYASAPSRPRAATRSRVTAAADDDDGYTAEYQKGYDAGHADGTAGSERDPKETGKAYLGGYEDGYDDGEADRPKSSRRAVRRKTAEMDDETADFLDNEQDRMESPTEAVDVVGEIINTGKASDIDGALAEARKDLQKWADWINSENELTGPDAYQSSDVEVALALLEAHWNE